MNFHQSDIGKFLKESIPVRFASLNQESFQSFIRFVLEKDGYTVERPVTSGRFTDIFLAQKEEHRIALLPVQGHLQDQIDIDVISILSDAMDFLDVENGWLITTMDVEDGFKKSADIQGIEVWDWEALYSAIRDLFFEGRDPPAAITPNEHTAENGLTLRVKWEPAEGTGAERYRMMLTIKNTTERHIYLHLELPALITSNTQQILAEAWEENTFVAGIIYAGASIRTYALYPVDKTGDRPPGGRVVLTCHERGDYPSTWHLQTRLRGEACYVVTYCFGRQSLEYEQMTRYRDQVLARSWIGRLGIELYYFTSPALIELADNYPFVNRMLRKLVQWSVGKIIGHVPPPTGI
jgi:hypothetical protein